MKQHRHRRAWVLWVVLVTVAISTVLLAQPAAAVPQPPHIFFGTVTVDGSAAEDGLAIEARIGGVNYAKSTLNSSGATVTNNGTYGTDGQSDDFQVTADDSDTTTVEGGVNGQVIEFFVNGKVTSVLMVVQLIWTLTPGPLVLFRLLLLRRLTREHQSRAYWPLLRTVIKGTPSPPVLTGVIQRLLRVL